MSKYIYRFLVCGVVVVVFLFIINTYIHYLVKNQYISLYESFTSANVDMPFTNKSTCNNFCSPNSTCSITGEQCSSDVDCSGCSSMSTPYSADSSFNVVGANDAGKLTVALTPSYSSLTGGFGTNERIITNHYYQKPAQGNFGTNNWKRSFEEGQQIYDRVYNNQSFNKQYPTMYSITGEFSGNGPMPANY